jgi:LPS-assembly protein
MHAELFVTFLRIFNLNKPLIEKLKHTIEPRLEYQYTPDFNQEDFPAFDIPDRYNKQHSITYSFTNRFTGLYKDSSGELSEREFGYFKVGQTFNLRRNIGSVNHQNDDTEFYMSYADFVNNTINTNYLNTPLKRYTDIFTEVRLNIIPRLYFKTKAGYNPYDNNLSYYNALISWESMTDQYLDLEYRYERNRIEEWDAKGKFKLIDPVYCFFDSTYNLLDSEKLDNEIGFDYRAQCWGAKLAYESNSKSGGQKSDSGVKFTFYLKGMGDTRNER